MALMHPRKPQPQVLVQQLVRLVQPLQGQGHLPGSRQQSRGCFEVFSKCGIFPNSQDFRIFTSSTFQLHFAGRLHGEVASPHHVSAIHKVSSCCSIERGRQRRARSMRIRAHGLRVVQGIACCIHWGTIREVANRVGEVGPWQWRSWSVRVWSNSLRVVDAVASPVQWCAVWQVASWAAVDTCCQSKITY